ncbi:MAG: extracellular solute-binding protein [Ilumatobacteraceae bacterium]
MQPSSVQPNGSSLPSSTSPPSGTVCVPNDDDGIVTIWHSMGGPAADELWKSLKADFENSHAVKLDIRTFGGDTAVIDELRTTVRSKWPDLVDISEQSTRTLLDTRQFALPSSCDASIGADLLPLVRATYTVNDQLVALPYGVSVPVLVFDAAEFRAAGLDPADPPSTFGELMDASAALAGSGVTPFGFVVSDSCANLVLEQFSAQRGTPEAAPDNGHTTREMQVDFATDANIADLTALADGVRAGHVKYLGSSENNLNDLLAIAEPAEGGTMTVHTSGALGDVIDILEQGSNFPGVELGVGSLPGPGPGTGSLVGGNALWVVNGPDAAQVGRAWSVVEWLYEAPQLSRLATELGYVPPTEAAAEDPSLLARWRRYPQLKVAYDQVVSATVTAASAGALFGPFEGRARVLFGACEKILAGGADVAATLEAASSEVNELLAQYEAQLSGETGETQSSTSSIAPSQSSEPVQLAGTVECASGEPVVGIWVEAESWPDANDGWAVFDPTDPGKANFTYTLQRGGRYRLHVGCGGSSATWGSTNSTGFVTGSQDFLCHDPPGPGECESI